MSLHWLTKTVNHFKICLEFYIRGDKMVLIVQAGQTVCTHSYFISLTVVVSKRRTWCWRRHFDKSLPMHCHLGLRHLQDQGQWISLRGWSLGNVFTPGWMGERELFICLWWPLLTVILPAVTPTQLWSPLAGSSSAPSPQARRTSWKMDQYFWNIANKHVSPERHFDLLQLGFYFGTLAVGSVNYDNTVLTKVIAYFCLLRFPLSCRLHLCMYAKQKHWPLHLTMATSLIICSPPGASA